MLQVDLRALRRRQGQRLRTLADLESKEQLEAAAAQAHAAQAEDVKLTELLRQEGEMGESIAAREAEAKVLLVYEALGYACMRP